MMKDSHEAAEMAQGVKMFAIKSRTQIVRTYIKFTSVGQQSELLVLQCRDRRMARIMWDS